MFLLKRLNLVYIGFLIVTCFWINKDYMLLGYCMDDTAIYLVYDSYSNVLSPLTDNWAGKYRPINNIIMSVIQFLLGTHIYIYTYILRSLNIITAIVIFFISYDISEFRSSFVKSFVSFLCAETFIISRFAYYYIDQTFGLMEGLALLLAVIILYGLFKAIKNGDVGYWNIAVLCYFLIGYIHERYLLLLILFGIAVILHNYVKYDTCAVKYKSITKKLLLPLMCFALNMVLRAVFVSGNILQGTGGQSILDTFSMSSFCTTFIDAIGYLFGVNNSDEYLNGISWSHTLLDIKVLVIISILVAIIIIIASLRKFKASLDKSAFSELLLILGFIFITMLSGCVTFRLEMRWLYTPYAGLLILMVYLGGYLHIFIKQIYRTVLVIGIIGYFIIHSFVNLYYREYWDAIYYRGIQKVANIVYTDAGKFQDMDEIIIVCISKWQPKVYVIENYLKPIYHDKKTRLIYADDFNKISDMVKGKQYALYEYGYYGQEKEFLSERIEVPKVHVELLEVKK